MLDHIFLSVSDIARSVAFYSHAPAPLGITDRLD
jgi:catechol 2,3-dioxygenase-like lactoylglutathione lyase family enzyme